MRRLDREMDRDFALSIVDKCEYAVLGTLNKDNTPYCIPVTIVRNENSIYFHCAKSGKKIDNLNFCPKVCITCVGDTHIVPGKFTTEYESAIINGTAHEITDDSEKIFALRILCERHTPDNMINFDEAIERSLKVTGIWRIDIESITGKRKKYGKDGKELKYGKME